MKTSTLPTTSTPTRLVFKRQRIVCLTTLSTSKGSGKTGTIFTGTFY